MSKRKRTRITAKQKSARRKNIAIARASKKKNSKKKFMKSTAAAEYLGNRQRGMSKRRSRSMAMKSATQQYKRLFG